MATFAVTGASGFVGSALAAHLRRRGDTVLGLRRAAAGPGSWDPASGRLELGGDADAVVHLAGENVAGGRWTARRMQRIHDSRVIGTANLCRALAALPRPPRVLVCASAIGFYGDRGDELLDERSGPGTGFLADVVRGWETATAAALAAGIRVVNLRVGMVLGRGGALARMLLPFRLGLGGRLGSGRQFVSWIALPDLVAAIAFCAAQPDLDGPVNATSPEPVTNAALTAALARALHRPAVLPVPPFALRLLLGRFADEALLCSQRVLPRRLLDAGFAFATPRIDAALAAVLAR